MRLFVMLISINSGAICPFVPQQTSISPQQMPFGAILMRTSRPQLICPTQGKSVTSSKITDFWKNIYIPFFGRVWLSPGHPASCEGRIAIVTARGARDAMDVEMAQREFLAPTNAILRTAKACGPGTPGLVLSMRLSRCRP
jgi:hypothetical protein